MEIEEYIIEQERLKTLGVRLTKMGKDLRDVALEQHRQDALFLNKDINDVTVLAAKMNRGYFRVKKPRRMPSSETSRWKRRPCRSIGAGRGGH